MAPLDEIWRCDAVHQNRSPDFARLAAGIHALNSELPARGPRDDIFAAPEQIGWGWGDAPARWEAIWMTNQL